MRIKQKLYDIKVYKYNVNTPFYRAESNGMSVPGNTVKLAISNLIKELRLLE